MQTTFGRAHTEHKSLLTNVKTTVEQLFLTNRSNGDSVVQSTTELVALHSVVEQIFVHGIRKQKPDRSPDIWAFIEGLNWLNPSMTVSVANLGMGAGAKTAIPDGRIRSNKSLVWIYENLALNQLNYKLKYLVSDTEHLNSCYEVWAFLQSSKYREAFLLCLRAIENNQPNLLTQIDVTLLIRKQLGLHSVAVGHKRSTSHPNFCLIPGVRSPIPCPLVPINTRPKSPTRPITTLRPWSSLPNLYVEHIPHRSRSHTITHTQPIRVPNVSPSPPSTPSARLIITRPQKVPSTPCQPLEPVVEPSDDPSDIRLLRSISLVKCDDIKIHFDRNHNTPTTQEEACSSINLPATPSGIFSFMPMFSSRSPTTGMPHDKTEISSPSLYTSILAASGPAELVNAFVPQEGEKLYSRHVGSASSLSPVFSSADEHATHHSSENRSQGGQSLTSFLQTRQFSRAHNDLDRENAHFSVCEAMIATIEQIKWKRWTKAATSNPGAARQTRWPFYSDRPKRRPRHEDTNTNFFPAHAKDSNDKYRRTVMSGSSSSSAASSLSSSTSLTSAGSSSMTSSKYQPMGFSSDDRSKSSPDGDETTLTGSTQNLAAECQAYAEWGGTSFDNWSAESVALSLISKFSDKQMPRACDIQWLVSEQDAPQTLLPMPGSWIVNPDELYQIPFTRGTRDWAPPRAQIIFTRHPKKDRKTLLYKQNQRCAGCGMRVATAYSYCFRYCEYLGRYHCTNCHRNQISVIPSRVLDAWDFATFPVSVFAYRLLEEIWTVPLFRVSHLNRALYAKVKALQIARQRREQLKYVRNFVVLCRFAEEDGTQKIFEQVASHIVDDVDVWSMADFTAVRLGTFVKDINALISRCERQHVQECELCKARGFICEYCPRKQTIYPWQPKVRRCTACGVCVHESCWQDDCAKCERLHRRQQISVAIGMSRLAPTLAATTSTEASPTFKASWKGPRRS